MEENVQSAVFSGTTLTPGLTTCHGEPLAEVPSVTGAAGTAEMVGTAVAPWPEESGYDPSAFCAAKCHTPT